MKKKTGNWSTSNEYAVDAVILQIANGGLLP